MTAILLFAAIGALLAQALPTGVEPDAVYVRPTEADFEHLLKKKGLL